MIFDHDIKRSIKNYSRFKGESIWIPKAIAWGFQWFLEFACNKRAKELVKIIKKNYN
jgi:hypothetical protein